MTYEQKIIAAWNVLAQAERECGVVGMAHERACNGNWPEPQTVEQFLGWIEDEAIIQEEQYADHPEETERAPYARQLRLVQCRLLSLGFLPAELPWVQSPVYIRLNCLNSGRDMVVRITPQRAKRLVELAKAMPRLLDIYASVLHATVIVSTDDIGFVQTNLGDARVAEVLTSPPLMMSPCMGAAAGARVYPGSIAWVVDWDGRMIQSVLLNIEDLQKIAEGGI
jgi:hypothetical protein